MCAEAGEQEEERAVTNQAKGRVWHDLRTLGCHPVFIFSMLAACPSSGVFGALSYWGPHVSALHNGGIKCTTYRGK